MNTDCKHRPILHALAFVMALAVASPLGAAGDDSRTAVTIDDRDLENAIESRLRGVSSVDDKDIDVFVRDGVVKLSGSVASMAEKTRAIHTVRGLRGVRGVADELSVAAGNRDDAAIRDDVAWALRQDPLLRDADIQVSVSGGHVRLMGSVDGWTKKSVARDVAQSIAGVSSIDDGIVISPASGHTDKDIAEQISRRLSVTRGLADDEISVFVTDGRVELQGTVDYFAESDLAAELAWVPGVTAVTNGVIVSRDDPSSRRAVTVSDVELKSVIERRLMEQPFMGMDDIDVNATGGVVTLSGDVPSIRTKEAAIRQAQLTNGVVRVIDSIKVQGAAPDVATLQEVLERQLASSAVLSDNALQVRVEESGAVHLAGTVDSFYERNHAVQLVARYPGVTEIVNNLDVGTGQTLSDAELAQAIADELRWSAYVDAADIHVNVENGVVTLSGTVTDLSEYEAVIDNAYQAGARDVTARLRLENGGLIEDDVRIHARYIGPK